MFTSGVLLSAAVPNSRHFFIMLILHWNVYINMTPWFDRTEGEHNSRNPQITPDILITSWKLLSEEYVWTFEGYYIEIKTPNLSLSFAISQTFLSFLVFAWLILKSVKWLLAYPVYIYTYTYSYYISWTNYPYCYWIILYKITYKALVFDIFSIRLFSH